MQFDGAEVRVKLQVNPNETGNIFNLGDSWYYKLWVEPCTTVLLFVPSYTTNNLVNDALLKWHRLYSVYKRRR